MEGLSSGSDYGYGNGYGNGYSNGNGYGSGYGYGYGSGYGSGSGYGYGSGYGSGSGDGNGYGYGYGYGSGYGSGSGVGNGYGNGYGIGYGSGYGYGDGNSYGYGSGSGYGYGYGYGSIKTFTAFVRLAPLTAAQALSLDNAELRRVAIEALGPDRFFSELEPAVVHEDIDGIGNRRRLLRVRVPGAVKGYLQAVEVTCPTTGHVYHLGVQQNVRTCQEAVASTFGLKADEYRPVRES